MYDVIAIIAFFISCLFLYAIIRDATKASKRAKLEAGILEMLARIAKQQGVPEEDIKRTLNKYDK